MSFVPDVASVLMAVVICLGMLTFPRASSASVVTGPAAPLAIPAALAV